MGRRMYYQLIATPEKMALVNPANIALRDDFINYMKSLQRSEGTIVGYKSDLNIVLVYILEHCDNIDFAKVKKRQWVGLQSWLIDEHKNSPARVRRIKACVSSLSNYIVNVLQEDGEPGFENFRSTIRTIESPRNEPVREKTILTDEDCEYVLKTLVDQKDYEQACFFALAIYSGRRKSELLRYKVEYFNDDHLICNGALYSTIETIKTKGSGVNGKQIVCYCLAKPFKPYFDLWMQERERLGIESPWLFPNRNDPLEQRGISSANVWAEKISVILTLFRGKNTTFYCHSARHRLVTMLSKLKVPHAVIKEFINWSDISMVAVYDDNDMTDRFADYFTPDGIKGQESKSLSDL